LITHSNFLYFVFNKPTHNEDNHCAPRFYNNDTFRRGEFDLAFDWRTGTFQGEQFALFCFNPKDSDGFVDVDWFKFSDKADGEKPVAKP
jgi:hypothetical protein